MRIIRKKLGHKSDTKIILVLKKEDKKNSSLVYVNIFAVERKQ